MALVNLARFRERIFNSIWQSHKQKEDLSQAELREQSGLEGKSSTSDNANEDSREVHNNSERENGSVVGSEDDESEHDSSQKQESKGSEHHTTTNNIRNAAYLAMLSIKAKRAQHENFEQKEKHNEQALEAILASELSATDTILNSASSPQSYTTASSFRLDKDPSHCSTSPVSATVKTIDQRSPVVVHYERTEMTRELSQSRAESETNLTSVHNNQAHGTLSLTAGNDSNVDTTSHTTSTLNQVTSFDDNNTDGAEPTTVLTTANQGLLTDKGSEQLNDSDHEAEHDVVLGEETAKSNESNDGIQEITDDANSKQVSIDSSDAQQQDIAEFKLAHQHDYELAVQDVAQTLLESSSSPTIDEPIDDKSPQDSTKEEACSSLKSDYTDVQAEGTHDTTCAISDGQSQDEEEEKKATCMASHTYSLTVEHPIEVDHTAVADRFANSPLIALTVPFEAERSIMAANNGSLRLTELDDNTKSITAKPGNDMLVFTGSPYHHNDKYASPLQTAIFAPVLASERNSSSPPQQLKKPSYLPGLGGDYIDKHYPQHKPLLKENSPPPKRSAPRITTAEKRKFVAEVHEELRRGGKVTLWENRSFLS